VLAICDRLAGGADKIRDAAGVPYIALTTIDEIYPSAPTAARPPVPGCGGSQRRQ